jgi:hypothetical protein
MIYTFLITCALLCQDIDSAQSKPTNDDRAKLVIEATDALVAHLEEILPRLEKSLKAAKQGKVGQTSKIRITSSGSGNREKISYLFPSKEHKENTVTELAQNIKDNKDQVKQLKSRDQVVFPELTANSRVGDFGQFPNKSIPVIQIIERERLLCTLSRPTIQSAKRATVMVYGVDTTGWIDGQAFDCELVFEITGTETYDTANGGSQTVFILKPIDTAPILELLKKPKK